MYFGSPANQYHGRMHNIFCIDSEFRCVLESHNAFIFWNKAANNVEERSLAGGAAHPGEAGPAHKRVQETGFAYVRPADEGDLG